MGGLSPHLRWAYREKKSFAASPGRKKGGIGSNCAGKGIRVIYRKKKMDQKGAGRPPKRKGEKRESTAHVRAVSGRGCSTMLQTANKEKKGFLPSVRREGKENGGGRRSSAYREGSATSTLLRNNQGDRRGGRALALGRKGEGEKSHPPASTRREKKKVNPSHPLKGMSWERKNAMVTQEIGGK